MMKDLFKQAGWSVGQTSGKSSTRSQNQPIPKSYGAECALHDPEHQPSERRVLGSHQPKKKRFFINATSHAQGDQVAFLCHQPPIPIPLAQVKLIESLPVSARADEIIAAIQQHQVVIIAGETGSGKTTQLPKLALLAGCGVRGRIALTQPRRLAARAVADRLAHELQTPLGTGVGVKVRFHQQVSQNTVIKVLTDGMLLAEIQQDPWLQAYDTIIVDEAHERSLNIDFLIGYLKQISVNRSDLKIIITSATIDLEKFAQFFNGVPTIQVSGRSYPVEVIYQPLTELMLDEQDEPDVNVGIIHAVRYLTHLDARGDILVFLPGEADIREASEALKQEGFAHTEVLPLYARQSFSDQQKIFHPQGGQRRIVLSTNVAETSLTVPGIRHVIDTGLARIKRYSPRNKVQRLPIEAISQAAANQRKGRCGRVASGICIRLYSEEDFLARPAFTEPEIQRSNLASVMLQMQTLGLAHISTFPLIDPPSSKLINDGQRLLEELQAVSLKGKLTPLGQQLAKLPTDPRIGRMLVAAEQQDVLAEMMVLAGVLTLQDPRETPTDKQQAAREKHRLFEDKRSDFLTLLNLWMAYEKTRRHQSKNQVKKWCEKHYLSARRMREWHELVGQLHQSASDLGWKIKPLQSAIAAEARYETDTTAVIGVSDDVASLLHRSILSGLLGQVATYDERLRYYQGARNVALLIHPSSVLQKQRPKWIMAFEWLQTSKTWARIVAEIDVAWLESLAKHLLKRQLSEPYWSKKQGRVLAKESLTLYGLVVVADRLADYGYYDAQAARDIFIRDGLVAGEVNGDLPFLQHNMALVQQALKWEDKTRRSDVLVDEETLIAFYQSRLPERICRVQTLQQWLQQDSSHLQQLQMTEQDVFRKTVTEAEAFPDQLQLPNQLKLPVHYRFSPGDLDDGMTLEVNLAQLALLREDELARLVPGFLVQKIEFIIRHLGKAQRIALQPASVQAKQAADYVQQQIALPFDQALAQALSKQSGLLITPDAWSSLMVPTHLKPNICVKNHKGKVIAQGRDLLALQKEFAQAERLALLHQSHRHLATDDEAKVVVRQWQWASIATTQKLSQGGQTYLALHCEGDGVRLSPFPSLAEANQAHQQGVRRLLSIDSQDVVKGMRKELGKQSNLCLVWARWQRDCQDLVDQLIDRAIIDLTPQAADIRAEVDYLDCLAQVKSALTGHIRWLATQAQQALMLGQGILAEAQRLTSATRAYAIVDIEHFVQQRLHGLFILDTDKDEWRALLRYLKAAAYRLEKLTENLPLDERRHQEFSKVSRLLARYSGMSQTHPERYAQAQRMAIECWVAIFAQPYSVKGAGSIKKIEQLLMQSC